MKLDLERSEVTLGDRRFPAVALVCPQDDVDAPRSAWDRSLGAPGPLPSVFIPGENGILVEIEEFEAGLSVSLYARTCERVETPQGEWTWLPQDISIVGNRLDVFLDRRGLIQGPHRWEGCDEWWVAEHLDRVTRMPYTEPDGPRVELVRLGAELEGKP
jgi:hypothetical protein